MNYLNKALKSVNSYWSSCPPLSSFRPDANTPAKVLESIKIHTSSLKSNKWTYVVLGTTALLASIYRIYEFHLENKNLKAENSIKRLFSRLFRSIFSSC